MSETTKSNPTVSTRTKPAAVAAKPADSTTDTPKENAADQPKVGESTVTENAGQGSATSEKETPEQAKASETSAVEQHKIPEPPTPPSAAPVSPAVAAVAEKPVSTPAPVKPALSREAEQVQNLLAEYTTLMSKPIVSVPMCNRGAEFLLRASRLVVSSPNDDVRDVMWQFHVDQKQKLMNENMALRGLPSIDGSQAQMVMTVYTLFRHKVMETNMPISIDRAMEQSSRRLIIYLDTKQ